MLRTLFADAFRLLTFRRTSPALHQHWRAFLAFGLAATWLAGIGRYWDNPRAHLWQTLGLGSLAYVFVLAAVIWVLVAPLKPRNWSYRNVLLFVTLTAPPALLYAIPVELFLSADAARQANAWFLAVVASWRVALYAVFLRRAAGLRWWIVVVATLLPLVVIVTALAALNLEHVVFRLMSGVRHDERSPHDSAYMVVVLLTYLSFLALPVLLAAYGAATWIVRRSGPKP